MIFFWLKLKSFGMLGEYAKLQKFDGNLSYFN
jgi:hypothetical protein